MAPPDVIAMAPVVAPLLPLTLPSDMPELSPKLMVLLACSPTWFVTVFNA